MKECFISSKLRPFVPGAAFDSIIYEDMGEHEDEPLPLKTDETILLLSSECDHTSRHFYDYCQLNKISIVYLTFEYVFESRTLVEKVVCRKFLGNFSGIYYRPPSIDSPAIAPYVALLESYIEFFPGKVVNRPKATVKNISKPWQMAETIMNSGEAVSSIATRLTNNPETMANCQPTGSIAKSISDVRSTVKDLEEIYQNQSLATLHCPVQIQEKLSGFNVRVHVMKDKLVAVKITSDSIDYRISDNQSFSEIQLPEPVRQWCFRAANAESLEIAGIDLFYTPQSDRYYCFEVNPCPGYHYYEKNAKLDFKISKWIVSFLSPKAFGSRS